LVVAGRVVTMDAVHSFGWWLIADTEEKITAGHLLVTDLF
jgi:hypothetical protein